MADDLVKKRKMRTMPHGVGIFWLKREGVVQSFRWKWTEAEGMLKHLSNKGWTEIQDPFRKGAPQGGYRS